MLEYIPEILKGLHTSLTLTIVSLLVALVLSVVFTIVLTLKTPLPPRWSKFISPCSPVPRCWYRSFDLLRSGQFRQSANIRGCGVCCHSHGCAQ